MSCHAHVYVHKRKPMSKAQAVKEARKTAGRWPGKVLAVVPTYDGHYTVRVDL